ncbi:5-methyltetrahydropteroyltriglutamate--homocysteine methyltransferase [Pseudomonas sp. Snoq117.2]|uniref:5-methyltetrahydropteroyltriglutamate-- homocysteine methyltransferase n=1 Tax=Pseudomonas sp. Snoq117.2 TaxID=1500302 RepID=UPI0008AF5521|nr:5-methyltetrahydropteroyltriglutamate--homocysteine methyltransferase [Pseudomonas sp. Snoq117.2]SEO59872.1 5-methyltetrahydropteroyltriglutamate--homocysteine methyltransferase [Pseudomonas sp. Snoq117.2]
MVKIHSQSSARREQQGDASLATMASLDDCDRAALIAQGREQRRQAWRAQQAAGCEWLTVGDFGWGDRVLAHSYLVGAATRTEAADDLGFAGPCQVPVFTADQSFAIGWEQLFDEVAEAQALGLLVKPVILGPLSYLWLGRSLDPAFDRLELLEALLPVYGEIFARLAAQGVEWIQIDEPLLTLELPLAWRTAFERAYNLLQREPLKKLLGVRHGELIENLGLAAGLPLEGLHVDWPRSVQAQQGLLDRLPAYKTLSLGLVEETEAGPVGQQRRLHFVRQAGERLQERLWLSPAVLSRDADATQADAVAAEFACLVRAARQAAIGRTAVRPERPWSAIEVALAKLGAAQSHLVTS